AHSSAARASHRQDPQADARVLNPRSVAERAMGAGVLFGARFVFVLRGSEGASESPFQAFGATHRPAGRPRPWRRGVFRARALAVERKVCAASASTCVCGKRCANSTRLGPSRVDGRPAASAHKIGVTSAASERLLTTDHDKVLRLATKLAAWRID